MSTHTGAHADAPFHYDADGLRAGAMALERYIGPCRVVHAIGAAPLVEPDHVRRHLIPGVTRVIVRTYARNPVEAWDPGFTAVAPATIELLAAPWRDADRHRHALARPAGLEDDGRAQGRARATACRSSKASCSTTWRKATTS